MKQPARSAVYAVTTACGKSRTALANFDINFFQKKGKDQGWQEAVLQEAGQAGQEDRSRKHLKFIRFQFSSNILCFDACFSSNLEYILPISMNLIKI